MKLLFLHGLGQKEDSWDRVRSYLPHLKTESLTLFKEGAFPTEFSKLEQQVRNRIAEIHDDVVLVGLSLGAVIGLSLLHQPPKNLKGLISCAGQYRLRGNKLYQLQGFIFKGVPKIFYRRYGVNKDDFLHFYDSLGQLDLSSNLLENHLPVLLICGEKDRANLKVTRELSKCLPFARLALIKGAGHVLNEEVPEHLAKLIDDYVKAF